MKLAQKWERENETERLDFVQTYPSSKMRFSEKKGGIRQCSKKKSEFSGEKKIGDCFSSTHHSPGRFTKNRFIKNKMECDLDHIRFEFEIF